MALRLVPADRESRSPVPLVVPSLSSATVRSKSFETPPFDHHRGEGDTQQREARGHA
jgi:hypothetical protein